MREFSDNEIIDSLRARQGDVVRYLFYQYLPMIRLIVIKTGGSIEDAKEIFQDGLVVLLEKIDDDKLILTCRFKTLFFTVCEKLWKQELKKRNGATSSSFQQKDL